MASRRSWSRSASPSAIPTFCASIGWPHAGFHRRRRAVVPGASVIAEYLDETRGDAAGAARLLPADLIERVETRRLSNGSIASSTTK